jgi:hypothetical protein
MLYGGEPYAGANLNPPFLMPLFMAMALLPPDVSLWVWRGLSVAVYCAIVFIYARRYGTRIPRVIWALALPGFWALIRQGQIYVVLLFLVVVAALALEAGKHWRAGLALGVLAAWKPNFVLWPVMLFVAGERRVAVLAGGVACALWIVPLMVLDPAITASYVEQLRAASALHYAGNLSLSAELLRHGAPQFVTVSVALVALGVAILAARRAPLDSVQHRALPLALLGAPIGWGSYVILLVPSMLSVTRWSPPLVMGAILFLIPLYILRWVLQVGEQIAGTLGTAALVLTAVGLWCARTAQPGNHLPTGSTQSHESKV